MKNLENYGVLEMDAKETSDIEGGFILIFLTAAALYIAFETLGNPSASLNAYNSGVAAGLNYNE